MSFTRTVASHSITKLFTEKWSLAMFLIIPLMMGGLFSLISGSNGQPKPVGTLLITDHDNSFLSQMIAMGFNQGPMAEMFITKMIKREEASKLMDQGKASVWIEIEKGFSDNYLNGKPSRLKLVKNPSQNILPEIAETSLNILADGAHYIQLLFPNELRQFNSLLKGESISDTQMALMSVQVKHTLDSLEQQLFPPQIKAVKRTITEQKSAKKTSFMTHMFPGILFMSLLFASQGMALEFWSDKSKGILSRLLSSPSGLTQYLNGKMMATVFVYALIAIIIGLLGLFLLRLHLSQLLILVLWLMLSGLVLGSMMLFICLLLPSKKSASVITTAMVFPLMMLGGSFFPFDAMPKWMAEIGQLLPNGYLLHSFNQWFIYNNPLSILVTPAAFALVFIVLMWLINKTLLPAFSRTSK